MVHNMILLNKELAYLDSKVRDIQEKLKNA